jgi:hypothetical protein
LPDCRPLEFAVKSFVVNMIVSLLKSTRVWGMIGTGAVLYLVVFVVFGKLDMSWIMPDTNQIARTFIEVWPRMPFFAVQRETLTNADGQDQGQVIYYTVPTRQLTPQDLAQMGATNTAARPAAPK